MDTTDLAGVYRDVIALAEWGSFLDPAQGWPARYVIAHLAMTDRALLRGLEEGVVDTTDTLDVDLLRREVDPLGALRSSSARLVDFVETIDEDEMKIRIPVRMVEPPTISITRRTPVGRLVRQHATVHVPAHLAELKSLVIRPVDAPGPSALLTARRHKAFFP